MKETFLTPIRILMIPECIAYVTVAMPTITTQYGKPNAQ